VKMLKKKMLVKQDKNAEYDNDLQCGKRKEKWMTFKSSCFTTTDYVPCHLVTSRTVIAGTILLE